MATPRVFISSTYYDLKYIRENLKYFIKTIGYEPILSEDGDVFYDPRKHTHDSCVSEVSSCQIFILIIGGRYGGDFKDTEKSITNTEFEEAAHSKIPVFALVESAVLAEHHVYTENLKKVDKMTADNIKYPSVSNVKIFDFIDDVRKSSINNAIVPFRDFSDIESYLKKQWAGMMYGFLTQDIEENRISDTLSVLTQMSSKIEFLSTQILNSVGTDKELVTIKLYEKMLNYDVFRDLTFMNIKPTPKDILKCAGFVELCQLFNINVKAYDEDKKSSSILTSTGEMGQARLTKNITELNELKADLIKELDENMISLVDYLGNDNK